MSAPTTAPAGPSGAPSQSAPRGRGRGRGRGGSSTRGGRTSPQSNATSTSSDAPAAPPTAGRGGRGPGGRGGRGGSRSANHSGGQSAGSNGNSRRGRFNGGLSSTSTRSGAPTAALVPALSAPSHAGPAPASQTLLDRLTAELSSGESDCVICFNEISKQAQISSCSTCFTPFHLGCLTKWAVSSVASSSERAILLAQRAPNQRGGGPSADELAGSWRCPNCNAPFRADEVPTSYRCFCARVANPQHRPPATPHSCGTQCSRKRPQGCAHPCPILCHPGPCPPCNVVLELDCHCSKTRKAVRCAQVNKPSAGATTAAGIAEVLSCGEPCGKMLGCGLHECDRPCHEGDCAECFVVRPKRCFCGSDELEEPCGVRPPTDRVECAKAGTDESWTGEFSCGKSCETKYHCGRHTCTNSTCHPHSATAPTCPFSPDTVSTCPCGQTPLTDLLPSPRTSCADSIPTCRKTCPRHLPCGHQCTRPCHSGECGACLSEVPVSCRCGTSTTKRQCGARGADGSELGEMLCERVCKAMRSCAKHECNRKCCALSWQEANKAKGKGRGRAVDYFPEEDPLGLHLCDRVCGKKQGCGQHNCPNTCHRGPCPPCLLAGFEEVHCHCGATVAMPPLPCNFRIDCRQPCIRPPPCGHPQMQHACHEEPECPPCPYLTPKSCACGKKTIPNVRCSQDVAKVSCGTPCGKLLRCGFHRCQKVCHIGACPDVCDQMCLKPRRLCGHPCTLPCHFPAQCSVDIPCDKLIEVSCSCGHTKQKAKCAACTAKAEGNSGRMVKCTPACEIAKRNAALAEALGIEKLAPKVKEVEYLPLIVDFYASNVAWATQIEAQLTDFVTSDDKKPSLHFPIMRRPQRQFVHELAEFFDLRSESLDEEPRRSVVVHRTSTSGTPTPTLAEALAAQRRTAVTLNLGSLKKALPERKTNNALYLEAVLGYDEAMLREILRPHMRAIAFTLVWKTEEDVLVSFPATVPEFTTKLQSIQHAIRNLIEESGFCSSVESVTVNEEGIITRGSWTPVAGSSSRSAPPGTRSAGATAGPSGLNGTGVYRPPAYSNSFASLAQATAPSSSSNGWRATPALLSKPKLSQATLTPAAPAFVPAAQAPVELAVERPDEDVPESWDAEEEEQETARA